MELRTSSLLFGNNGDFCWQDSLVGRKSVKNSTFGDLFIHNCNSNGMACILYDLRARESQLCPLLSASKRQNKGSNYLCR